MSTATQTIRNTLVAYASERDSGKYEPDDIAVIIDRGARQGWRPVRSLLGAGVPWSFIERAAWWQQGYDLVEISVAAVPGDAFEILPLGVARELPAVVVGVDGRSITIAVADPTDFEVTDMLRSRLHDRDVTLVVADRQHLIEALDELDLRGRTDAIEVTDEERDFSTFVSLDAEDSDGKIAMLVRNLIQRASAARASDIHIEPSEHGMRVRFRIDGVLHNKGNHALGIGQGVINRLKVMANLDVSERRVPQDGRFGLKMPDGRSIDVRLVTLPTVWEVEEGILRLLDHSRQVTDLTALGYSPHVLDLYLQLCANPHGAILATGPTGSGKSTTLSSTLSLIATEDKKVLTVEDPVEFRMPGVTQVQANPKAGLTFARALRSFLRADPDIMLVGECRDKETAFTAIEAALTGHLVLASLHANSAPSAATRLVEMQIEPFLVASALRGVISQRLVRVLCESCKQPSETPSGVADAVDGLFAGDIEVFGPHPSGCGNCSGTGFRGRMAIAEVMAVSENIKRAIADEASDGDLEILARGESMVPIRTDGLLKVAMGLTTMEEVGRATN